MGNVFLDVLAVGAGETRSLDGRVVNSQVETFANEVLGDEDDRAFAQIVCARLEGQAVQPHAPQAVVGNEINGPPQVRFVAGQNAAQQRQVHVFAGSQVQDHAQVLGQARAAER